LIRLLLDENFNGRIHKGLLRDLPDIEILRVQDVPELAGMDDPTILEWAAVERYIILTHDVETMIGFAYDRVGTQQLMAGMLVVGMSMPIGNAISEITRLTTELNSHEDWQYRVEFAKKN
jgi:hypothetical protein